MKFDNYECDGQISLSDYQIVSNGYNVFHEHCIHRGWLKKDEEKDIAIWMCGYAKGHPARGWDDWAPCTEGNCPLLK